MILKSLVVSFSWIGIVGIAIACGCIAARLFLLSGHRSMRMRLAEAMDAADREAMAQRMIDSSGHPGPFCVRTEGTRVRVSVDPAVPAGR